MTDISCIIPSSKYLKITMDNVLLYFIDIKNANDNYDFIYIQDLIKINFNTIIKKYIDFNDQLKLLENKTIVKSDLITLFNNIAAIINEKFEILNVFPRMNGYVYVYYYDVNKDFTKTLTEKMHIPSLQLTMQVKINNFNLVDPTKNTIFNSSYDTFFIDNENIFESGKIPTDYPSKISIDVIQNPIYDSHFPKHNIEEFSESLFDGFTKIRYELFDKDVIKEKDQYEFVIYVGENYIRCSEYDINTDIFYEKLPTVSNNITELTDIDFKEYKISKEYYYNNIFDHVKIELLKTIYMEYFSTLDMLIEDVENLQGMAINTKSPNKIVKLIIDNLMTNYYNLLNKLLHDIEKVVINSPDKMTFDICYIDYNDTIMLFAKNNNLIMTPIYVDEKLTKVLLTIIDVEIVFEQYTEEHTNDIINELCEKNIHNIQMIKVIMELNVKNLEDLLIKKNK